MAKRTTTTNTKSSSSPVPAGYGSGRPGSRVTTNGKTVTTPASGNSTVTSSGSSSNRTSSSSGSSSGRTSSSSSSSSVPSGAQLGGAIGGVFGSLLGMGKQGAAIGSALGAGTSAANQISSARKSSGQQQYVEPQPEPVQQGYSQADFDTLRQQLQDEYKRQTQSALDAYKSESQKQMDTYRQQAEAAQRQLAEKEAAIRAEQEARVKSNVASLNAAKPQVQQAGAAANRQAQQNYYDLINPNGAGAEARAALGLSGSGLTESAQIAAGNAYTGAVNSNQQNVDNQLAQIDLAITQAQLNGDLATAQQLQSYYEAVYNGGMQSANNLAQMGQQYAGTLANLGMGAAGTGANLGQWSVENRQQQGQQDADKTLSIMQFMEQQKQNNFNNLLAQAGLTGYFNGQQTMQGRQHEFDLYSSALDQEGKAYQNIALKRENARALLEYQLMQQFGAAKEEAAVKSTELANKLTESQIQNTDVDTLLQQLRVDYARKYGV